MHRICMVGAGYVGLVSGACLADYGNEVVCVDADKSKITSLEEGKIPFYESPETCARAMKVLCSYAEYRRSH